jgi:phosphoglycerate kinase
MIRTLKDLPDIKGMHVLVRCSFDVPIENGAVTDPLRLDAALPTIAYLANKGARVILMGHVGRDPMFSARPVYEYLKHKMQLSFVDDITGPRTREAASKLKDGEVLMIENLRRDAGERGNDDVFARALAALGDIYVNDAFTNTHRNHASMTGVPKYIPGYAGFQFMDEVNGLTPALNPESPSLAVIGGKKFETKAAVVYALLKKYDKLFIGGAIVNDFLKAKGLEVGKSLIADPEMVKPLLDNSKIILAEDVVVENPNGVEEKSVEDVHENDVIFDIGPKSMEALRPIIEKSRIILWNGPMGNFEKGFTAQTDSLAKMVASSKGKTVVGGGDTLASIQSLNLMDKFSFVSTAGGAMLDYLANGTLPGIDALEASKKL